MDKYLQYNSIELSEEDSFIRWVNGENHPDDFNWTAWLERYPGKAEIVLVAKSAVHGLSFKSEEIPSDTEDKIWSKVNSKISKPNKEVKQSKTVIRRISYGVAAAVAAFLVIVNLGGEFDTKVDTRIAQLESVNLPDGSVVLLNAESTLSYDKDSWSKDRLVTLDGEAFFEVQKGSKFTVRTDNGEIAVLGTSFNVYSRKRDFSVFCETGRVAVKTSFNKTILQPKQSVVLENKSHVFDEQVEKNENRSSWKTGVFIYKESPLDIVIEELERQLDVKIQIDNGLSNVYYTGSFNMANPESILSEVFWPLNLKFKQEGRVVKVSK